jgi:long-chain acyl-CoA synthetase
VRASTGRPRLELEQLHRSDTMRAEIQTAIDEINSHYARVEQIKRFEILPSELSQQAGELTPTLKVKRKIVQDKFADTIDAIYRRPDESNSPDAASA